MIRSPDSLRFGPRLDIAAGSVAGADPFAGLENQDNLLLIDSAGRAVFLRDEQLAQVQVDGWARGHVRIAVLDGMGGHGRGREAAEAVVAGLLEMPACTTIAQLEDHLARLHARLQAEFAGGADAERRPGTTLTLLELPPGEAALLYHVGDSRLYEITPERIYPLTVDHVPATAFAMTGVLGEQEWWQQVHGEHRSQIAQAFVLGNAFADPALLDDALFALTPARLPRFLRHLPDRRAVALRPDAVYLLATDGFWACAEPHLWVSRWPEILGAGRSAADMVQLLFDAIRTTPPPGLHIDNLTAIVLRPLADPDPEDETYA
ncbi:protein phosphatase 2C domain-containing protein [Massilia sp. R2A-15]|uniref:PP2C family protein-serine/threonine phosphatase n=1 Tax=Massilia sp. R2A-15 TaxID=3064278 RepID=UPI0027361647|nr:protein phosphatase 2C domain-containing protein [Massilia sp. R2A-15]WLI90934.1 protein phosphatase 2C domain-containing protein [Massilia sp. R2A-15]